MIKTLLSLLVIFTLSSTSKGSECKSIKPDMPKIEILESEDSYNLEKAVEYTKLNIIENILTKYRGQSFESEGYLYDRLFENLNNIPEKELCEKQEGIIDIFIKNKIYPDNVCSNEEWHSLRKENIFFTADTNRVRRINFLEKALSSRCSNVLKKIIGFFKKDFKIFTINFFLEKHNQYSYPGDSFDKTLTLINEEALDLTSDCGENQKENTSCKLKENIKKMNDNHEKYIALNKEQEHEKNEWEKQIAKQTKEENAFKQQEKEMNEPTEKGIMKKICFYFENLKESEQRMVRLNRIEKKSGVINLSEKNAEGQVQVGIEDQIEKLKTDYKKKIGHVFNKGLCK